MLKFPNFRCPGNKGPSEIYCNDTVKLSDLKNPLFGARILTVSLVSRVIAIFCTKSRCHGNKGLSEIYCNDTVILPDLENTPFVIKVH